MKYGELILSLFLFLMGISALHADEKLEHDPAYLEVSVNQLERVQRRLHADIKEMTMEISGIEKLLSKVEEAYELGSRLGYPQRFAEKKYSNKAALTAQAQVLKSALAERRHIQSKMKQERGLLIVRVSAMKWRLSTLTLQRRSKGEE